jgi:hypothetical protein
MRPGDDEHRASDHVPVSDSASIAWLRLGPAEARSAATARITVGRIPSSEVVAAGAAAAQMQTGAHELSPRVVFELTRRQWDMGGIGFGATIGYIVAAIPGAAIGAVVLFGWWRWMLAQGRRGQL